MKRAASLDDWATVVGVYADLAALKIDASLGSLQLCSNVPEKNVLTQAVF